MGKANTEPSSTRGEPHSLGSSTSDAARHDALAALSTRFAAIESNSEREHACPLGQYPVFRLDGIKASKQHLKDHFIHERFNEALGRAVDTTYYLFRNWGPKEAGNFFLCVTSFSDEVSFVLGNGGNYYDNRIMKIATVLAGTLSGAMTAAFHPRAGGKRETFRIEVAAFDARPLILADRAAVDDYLEYRWLVSYRNALSKALRLEKRVSDADLYETDLKNDLQRLAQLVDEHGLCRQVRTILSTYTLYVPGDDRALRRFPIHDETSFQDMLNMKQGVTLR